MCVLGIKPECFNPHVYFTFKGRYEENHVTKVHSHDFVTMIYVMSGGCTYTIDGVSYRVKKAICWFSTPMYRTAKTSVRAKK